MIPLNPFRQVPGLCGPASLKIVFSYYGIEKTEVEIAKLCDARPEMGVPASGLITCCEHLGLHAILKDEAELKDIIMYVQNNIPVLVQWWCEDDGHWSVVVKVDTENIYLQDPHLGMMRAMRLETFYRNWFDFHQTIMKKENLILRRMIAIEKFA